MSNYPTRRELCKVLPKSNHLEAKALKIAGIPNGKDPRPLEACMIWLAVNAGGGKLSWYLSDDSGRWIMHVESVPLFIEGESLTLAALRAVVVVHCRREWLKNPPDERPDFLNQLREFMAQ